MARSKDKIKILNFECQYIYEMLHQKEIGDKNINIRDASGNISIDNFTGYLDSSLERDKLQEVYSKHRGDMPTKFAFRVSKYDLTTAVINVEFKSTYKTYNKERGKAGNVFVLDGYSKSNYKLKDHVCVEVIDGKRKLVAIEMPFYDKKTKTFDMDKYGKVECPIDKELLGKYFVYDAAAKRYGRKILDSGNPRPMPKVASIEDIRRELYVNGFDVDGVHYVRYKRSAGRSREGSCLFIAEPLFKEMMEWTATGLDMNDIKDLPSWEAYIALTLSKNIGTIDIPKASILVMRDREVVFPSKVVVVKKNDVEESDGFLEEVTADTGYAMIKNNIWDGESLLDSSVFENNRDIFEKDGRMPGMCVLRNNFFKTCAFNTNIQQWFKDNNITSVSELNGFTTARKVEDIKLITTYSSLKYLKMLGIDKDDDEEFEAGVHQWLRNINKKFGVVKYDSKTKFMNGKLVSTTYQLINTLELSRDDVRELLMPTKEYIFNIKKSPMYLRHFISGQRRPKDEEMRYNYRKLAGMVDEKYGEDMASYDGDNYDIYKEEYNDYDDFDGLVEEDEEDDFLDYRYTAARDILEKNDLIAGTEFYQDVQRSAVKSISNKMRAGKILVSGLYATLFGNGAELLKAVINDDFDPNDGTVIEGSNIYCTRFADGVELLCSRNPHITMGNILVAKNQRSTFYDRYFNLTDEIVCVNAVRNNIQQRLNGCDYDSDTMLITDNELLLKRAKQNYDKFLVPTCMLSSASLSYENTMEDRARLDNLIAKSEIGQIINISQLLNSDLWDKRHKDYNEEKERWQYQMICKLAVLSGVAIDKAKRLYDVDIPRALSDIIQMKDYLYKVGKPMFFEYINKRPKGGIVVDTAMQYFYELGKDDKETNKLFSRDGLESKPRAVKLSSLFDWSTAVREANDYRYEKEIIAIVTETVSRIKAISKSMRSETDSEKIVSREKKVELLRKCKREVHGKLKNDYILKLLIGDIDNDKRISGIKNTLFGVLYHDDGERLKDLLNSASTMTSYELQQVETPMEGITVDILGIPHMKVML